MGIIVEKITASESNVAPPDKQADDTPTDVIEVSEKEETIEIPNIHEISLSDFDFHLHGFVSNEIWSKSFNLHARITKILKEKITCECVIDRENQLFETRSFPILLFNHLPKKEVNYPIIVSIKTRPGSTRIDIRDGKKLSIFPFLI